MISVKSRAWKSLTKRRKSLKGKENQKERKENWKKTCLLPIRVWGCQKSLFLQGLCPYAYEAYQGSQWIWKNGSYTYGQVIRVCNDHLATYMNDTWFKFYIVFGSLPFMHIRGVMHVWPSRQRMIRIWYVWATIYNFSDVFHSEPYAPPFPLTNFLWVFLFSLVFLYYRPNMIHTSNQWTLFFFILWFWQVYLSWAPIKVFFFAGHEYY